MNSTSFLWIAVSNRHAVDLVVCRIALVPAPSACYHGWRIDLRRPALSVVRIVNWRKVMANYSILVDRQGLWTGLVHYMGSFSFSCPCWWDPGEQIPTGIYYGCSATHMATKKNPRGQAREGIFLPGVPERTGIFIHHWPGTEADVRLWSDGCALLLDADMMRIWNDIYPKNARNVTVTIQNSLPGTPPGPVPVPYPNTSRGM